MTAANSNATTRPIDRAAVLAGRKLAVEMMRKLRAEWIEFDLAGVPDNKITETMLSRDPATMRCYIAKAQENPDRELGFLGVLSDFLGGELNSGNAGDIEFYALRRR